MPTPDLRPATASDYSFVRDIFARPENAGRLDSYSEDAFAAAVSDPAMDISIYPATGAPKGYVWLSQIGKRPGTVKVEELAIAAPGQGFGRALIAALVAKLGEMHLTQIWLRVAENNGAAIRFYESLGFEKDGQPEIWTGNDGREVPVYRMEARLSRLQQGLETRRTTS